MMIPQREPAFWIGLAGSLILAVAQTLAGNGLLTDDAVQTVTNLVTTLAPLIAGLVTRYFVTPVPPNERGY